MTASLVSMALGAFRFAVLSQSYDQIRHELEERWESVDRAGSRPALHWAGHGAETLTLSGAIFPAYHHTLRFPQALRQTATQAVPQLLVDGLGFYWGDWVIQSVSEASVLHTADGAPRQQTWTIRLQYYEGAA